MVCGLFVADLVWNDPIVIMKQVTTQEMTMVAISMTMSFLRLHIHVCNLQSIHSTIVHTHTHTRTHTHLTFSSVMPHNFGQEILLPLPHAATQL